MMRIPCYAALALLLAACTAAPARGVEPPRDVKACDAPNDDGTIINLEWQLSPSDTGLAVDGYAIERSTLAADSFQAVAWVPRGNASHQDNTVERTGQDYYYRVVAQGRGGDSAASAVIGPVQAKQSWFNTGKVNTLIGTVFVIFISLYMIYRARKGDLFIRKIAGLDAVEEAVGRATEMGKPILYCLGVGLIDSIATIASLNILSQVAKKTAEYETPLIVPTCDPMVHAVAREMVKEGYKSVGRPDAYKEDYVYFITSDQMGYAAALSGIMAREKPATNFFLGYYAAESLILAESGAATGAIQIAGTDQLTQLPFFITSCDYTLLGEELFAASAYLSKEPLLVGSLKGQDVGKVFIIIFVVLGTLLALLFRSDAIYNLFTVY